MATLMAITRRTETGQGAKSADRGVLLVACQPVSVRNLGNTGWGDF